MVFKYKCRNGKYNHPYTWSEDSEKLIVPNIETSELLKYTGIYTYLPSQNKSTLNENPKAFAHMAVINTRRTVKKSPYQPQSNALYSDIHKTFNLVNRMYEKVYEIQSKKYPELTKYSMPEITVKLQDRPYDIYKEKYWDGFKISVGTSKSLACAYLGSNRITLTTRSMKIYKGYKAEKLILHELGHGMLNLGHCKRRGKRNCSIMTNNGTFFWGNSVTPNQWRTRFRKLIYERYYKSQIKRLREMR